MKQIIVWVGISLTTFILFIAGSFLFLKQTEPQAEPVEVAAAKVNQTAFAAQMELKDTTIDSLQTMIKTLQSDLFFTRVTIDSLNEQCGFKDGVIDGFDQQIAGFQKELTQLQGRRTSVKELAKTYETMKSAEMAPILDAVDNNTIIALYENMSSRTRKNIIQALPGARAAQITKELAGVSS